MSFFVRENNVSKRNKKVSNDYIFKCFIYVKRHVFTKKYSVYKYQAQNS